MRKMKKFAVVALGLALLITISLFLPAGAAITGSRNPEVKSQELVVCETDTSGVIEKVRVIDVMSIREQSSGGSITVKETNEFAGEKPKKVTGVNSFLKPSLEGDYIVWNDLSTDTNSNNVVDTQFSKAMVEEARSRIPLDVTYRYFFNGQLVSDPKDIVGKTGHFRLEATFVNTSAEKMPVKYKDPDTGETVVSRTDVYLPLVIQPYDWKFDNQHFFNLEVDPTSVMVPMPEAYQPGWSIPLFPPATDKKASIWVEADVKDFRMPALTLVVAFVFPETNQVDPLEQLTPGIKALYEGIKQLDAGLNTAVVGLGSAATPDTLIYGISQVTDGLMKMSVEGIDQLKAGVDTMIPKVNEAYNGLGSATTPNTLLYAAAQSTAGLEQMYGGTNLLLGGLDQMKAGIGSTATPDTLLYAVNAVQSGLNGIYGGLSQVMLGLSNSAPPGILEGLQSMKGALDAPYPNGVVAGLQAMAAGIGPAATPGTLLNQVNQLIAMFSVDNFPTAPPNCTMYAYVNHNAAYGGLMNAQDIAVLNGMMSALAGQLTAALPNINLMYNSLVAPYPNGLIAGLQAMSAGMGSMIAGIGNTSNPATMLGGLAYMRAGIGTASTPNTLLYAMARVQFALQQMAGGIGSPSDPLSLIGGVSQMQTGIGSATTPDSLLFALNAMTGGMTQIKYGMNGAAIGEVGLVQGLEQVSGGLGQINTTAIGSAGTPDTLLYGTNLIQEGMVTMQEGLTQATAEGTQVMITTLDGSIATLNLTQGELDAIKERAAEFNAFLSRPTDGESEVRFIYQTPATYKYTDSKTSGYVALIISLLIAAGLVLLGLFAFRKLA